MPKISTGQKRGIRQSIARHRVRGQKEDGGNDGKSVLRDKLQYLGFSRSKYLSFGRKSFDVTLAICQKLHLIGFTRTQDGEFVELNRKNLIGHYAAIVVFLVICLQKIWGTMEMLLYQELRMESFICVTVSLAHVIATVLGSVVIMSPKETMDLLNSWSHVSDSLKMINSNSEFHPLGSISVCLKTGGGLFTSEAVPPLVAILSLIWTDMAILWFPMVERFGLIPVGILPRWAWQIVFAGIEWLTCQPFMMMAILSTNFMYIGNGALRTFVKELK